MKLRVVDFETTGTPEDRQRGKAVGIVEAAFCDVDEAGIVSRPTTMLVNPGIAIPPEARAVHHISDDMVAGAIDPGKACMILMGGMEPGDIFCAHHAEFERSFFAGGAFPWICTMKCAKHLWPDAPSFSNQALRYYLNLEEDFAWSELTLPPHRAGPDCYVTAHILARQVLMKHPQKLIELTGAPVLQLTVRFGQNYGKKWEEMDFGFLDWCVNKAAHIDAEAKHTARHWLNQSRGLAGTPFA
jgi:exodeoxyribonuclease X